MQIADSNEYKYGFAQILATNSGYLTVYEQL